VRFKLEGDYNNYGCVLSASRLSYERRFKVENTIMTESDAKSVEKVIIVSYLMISNKFRAF